MSKKPAWRHDHFITRTKARVPSSAKHPWSLMLHEELLKTIDAGVAPFASTIGSGVSSVTDFQFSYSRFVVINSKFH